MKEVDRRLMALAEEGVEGEGGLPRAADAADGDETTTAGTTAHTCSTCCYWPGGKYSAHNTCS